VEGDEGSAQGRRAGEPMGTVRKSTSGDVGWEEARTPGELDAEAGVAACSLAGGRRSWSGRRWLGWGERSARAHLSTTTSVSCFLGCSFEHYSTMTVSIFLKIYN
jgi:hypothetical protein